jgi:hypothetical protein
MFLSITMPRGTKNGSIIQNKCEQRAVRLGQSLGIVLVTHRKQNTHR